MLAQHTLMVKVARSCETGFARGRPAGVCLVALFVTEAIDLIWGPALAALERPLALNRTCLYMLDIRLYCSSSDSSFSLLRPSKYDL